MKIKQLLKTICLLIIIWAIYSVTVKAASTSLRASSTTVTVGTKVTVTASGNAAAWDLSLSGDGISSTPIVGFTNDAENGDFSESVSFTPSRAGTYTITLTGNVTDEDSDEASSVNRSVTVTVKSKSSGSSSSGSSSRGSSNNGSSNQTSAPSFSSRNETVYATDSVNVRSSYSTSSSVLGSLNKGDSVKRTGIATKAVNGITWSRVTYNGQTAYISSSYLTTEEPEEEKSNNKNLKSLTVDGYEITPTFSNDVTEYSLNIDESVDALTVKAVAEDEKAKVEITGNDNLLIGENTIEIKVTAEDETVKTYKINVTKGEAVGIQLSELNVEGYTLNPEFNSDIYEYTLNINDTSVTSINIDAKSNTENAIIEIAGNNELKLGENLVTILVKSEDEKDVATYQIIVNIEEKQEEQILAGIDNADLFLYAGIGIGILIIIIIIIVIIVKRRRKDDDDFSTYYGGFNSLDAEHTDKKDNPESKLNNEDIEKISQKRNEIKTNKKDIIEENFGANINSQEFSDEDKSKRNRGKHF